MAPNIRKRKRFDLLELLLIAAFVATATWVVKPQYDVNSSPSEALPFAERYGPDRQSQYEEEWLIRDFFRDKRDRVFLDVGANHYRTFSNTYYLETELGWSGIAVEPLRQFEADYVKHRPRTRFRAFFVSDVSNQEAKIYLGRNPLVTSADRSFTERYGADTKEVTAPTITLNDLLDHENVKAIDFLTMDIELWEPKALAGFDIERFRPALACIEAHPEVRQQILDYFAQHHYVIVGRYLRADPQNLYFMPQQGAAPATQ
jgi:FkbM family methyltransferase